jgi:hypothetical protein
VGVDCAFSNPQGPAHKGNVHRGAARVTLRRCLVGQDGGHEGCGPRSQACQQAIPAWFRSGSEGRGSSRPVGRCRRRLRPPIPRPARSASSRAWRTEPPPTGLRSRRDCDPSHYPFEPGRNSLLSGIPFGRIASDRYKCFAGPSGFWPAFVFSRGSAAGIPSALWRLDPFSAPSDHAPSCPRVRDWSKLPV